MADYTVSGAGETAYNGDYTQNGTFNGQPKYEISGGGRWLFYAYAEMEITYYWAFGTVVEDGFMGTDFVYMYSSITGTYWVGMGVSPAPTVAEAASGTTHSISGTATGEGTATATLSIVAGGTTHYVSGTASGESTATATLSIAAGGTKARIAAGTTLSINGELIGSIMHINAVGGGTAEIVATTNHQSDYRYTEGLQGLRSFGELQFAGAAISTEKFASVGAVEFEVAYPGQLAWRGAGFITKVLTGAAIDEMIPYAITAQICIICSGLLEAAYSLGPHPYIPYLAIFGDESTGGNSWIWDFGDGTGLYYEALGDGVTGYEIAAMSEWLADNMQGRGAAYSNATVPTEILHAYPSGAASATWIVSGAGDDSYNGEYADSGETYNGAPIYVKAATSAHTYTTTLTISDMCGSEIATHDITVGSDSPQRWLYWAYIITDMEYLWALNITTVDADLPMDLAYYSPSTIDGTWYRAGGTAPAPTITEA